MKLVELRGVFDLFWVSSAITMCALSLFLSVGIRNVKITDTLTAVSGFLVCATAFVLLAIGVGLNMNTTVAVAALITVGAALLVLVSGICPKMWQSILSVNGGLVALLVSWSVLF